MELPKRKLNRLGNYDYSQNGCYFITICTQNKMNIFEIESLIVGNDLCVVPPQNKIIHKWIKETENKFPSIKIEKYVIMPNHLHFIMNITERHKGRSLQDAIRFFKTMTTNEYIHYVKKGIFKPFNKKLWQKSYYDHIIRDQNDYNEISEYIENNPKKWLLTKQHQGDE